MFKALVIIADETPYLFMNPLSDLIGILFWVARSILLLLGGGGGLFMIVKGKTEENPRDTQEGFLALVGAGVLIAATFPLQLIFTK